MTLILSAVSKCAVCGQIVKHKLIASTNAFGSPDLDFRPPEMRRSTMPHWATRCPHCGYVAAGIDKKISARERKRIVSILNSREYQTCDGLNLPDETARKFYQQYLLYRDVKRDATLFSYLQNCIWKCDDYGNLCRVLAKNLRRKAIPYLETAIKKEHSIQAREKMILVLADFYRRADEFKLVKELLEGRMFKTDSFERIAAYQLELAGEKDNRCHLIWEATRICNMEV